MRVKYISKKPDDYPFEDEAIETQGEYIFDDSGFFIDEDGYILPIYMESEDKFFSVINLEKVYFHDLLSDYKPENQYRRIKYLKSKKMWRAECPGVKVTELHKSIDDAAVHANDLAEGTDWIPNIVPLSLAFMKSEWVEQGVCVGYTDLDQREPYAILEDFKVFLAISHDSTFFILDTEANGKYVKEHLKTFLGRIRAVHMDELPKHISGTQHVQVTLPKDVPYKSTEEYQAFAVEGLKQLCHVLGG